MFTKSLEKIPWKTYCDLSYPYRVMTVQVGFSSDENMSDEVEFCINAWNAEELTELFTTFCKENHLKKISVHSISIITVASSFEELAEIEERGNAV